MRGVLMVVVDFHEESMKKLISLDRKKIIEGLTEIGAPCEYDKETKKIIVELTPNRPDWYSMEGLARALRSYYENKIPSYSCEPSDYKVTVDKSVEKVRPYTSTAVVKNLKLDDERITDLVLLQEKLLATLGRRAKKFGIGLYPLERISFPLSYTTMKPEEIVYRPLTFEKEAKAKEILENHPKGLEYGDIIKGMKRYPVYLDGKNKIMALLPIVNSEETGRVTEETKGAFIEVTGTEKHACEYALNIIVCTLMDMGGKAYSVGMDYPDGKKTSPVLEPRKESFDFAKASKILGVSLSKKEMEKLLRKMGMATEGKNVLVPPYRADIISWVDIVEDIAIAYGYNNFKPTLPNFFHPGKSAEQYEEEDSLMRGMGFVEITTFILTNKEKMALIGYEKDLKEISNPSSTEFTSIRPTLAVDMLDVFTNNKMGGLPQKYYEIGTVFEKGETRKKLIFAVMDKNIEFSAMRGHLQTLMAEKGMSFELVKSALPLFEKDMSAEVQVDGKKAGIFGKVSKNILERFGIEFEVYLCELDLR